MTALPAKALCTIGTFTGGECRISLTTTAITISDSYGVELGSWPYNVIRQFRGEDLVGGKFSFTSGRRGPFGVGDYDFYLAPLYLNELKSSLTKYTGAQFGACKSPERSRDSPSSDALHHCIASVKTFNNQSPDEDHKEHMQQCYSWSALAHHSEHHSPIIKKQLTLKEVPECSQTYCHNTCEATSSGIPIISGELVHNQQSPASKRTGRNEYVEIDPLQSDNKPLCKTHLHQSANDGIMFSNIEAQKCNDDLQTETSAHQTSIQDSFNSGMSSGHIYDKLPPRLATDLYDTPHSSVYRVPRFNENLSPPLVLNTRQSSGSFSVTRRPLPETPIEILERNTSMVESLSRNSDPGYVDIDIQERANGNVYMQVNNPSMPNILVKDDCVVSNVQPVQMSKFKPTSDIGSQCIAQKLATEGYELVVSVVQNEQPITEDKVHRELLTKTVESMHLNESTGDITSIGEGDDDSDGYVVVRSHKPAATDSASYENIASQNEMDEDEQYAKVVRSQSSEKNLYKTVQLTSSRLLPISATNCTHSTQKTLERTLVPLVTENPSPTTTAELRFRARTVGDILDVEKHTYVNIKCEDDSTLIRKSGINLANKKPKPSPRNSSSSRLPSLSTENLEDTI